MPALTPAQRKKQIELQRQREAAANKNGKPKPGQKGQQTGNKGSSSKAGTIGGGKDKPKPTPAAAPRPTTSGRPTSRFAGARDAAHTRARAIEPTTSSRTSSSSSRTSPSASRSSSSTPSTSSRSTPTPSPSKAPSSASKTGGSYGESGKDLYNAHKKDNPLMKRTFGYQTGDAPDPKKTEAPKTGGAVVKDAPNGKPYYGPAYGERSGPAKPAEPAKPASPNEKPDAGYKPSTKVDGSQYADKKPANNTKVAFGNAGEGLAEALRKRRQSR
jgi:hypothetical protein